MHVFCDFDGTISTLDSTDYVLTALAHKIEAGTGLNCAAIEQAWENGEFGSAVCMQRQIALIEGDLEKLNAVLDQVEIDPGFSELVTFCQQKNIPLTVVSDGVDYFIRRILGRHGYNNIRVLSNRLKINQNGYSLNCDYSMPACAARAGVCKCAIVKETAFEDRIFIGDGRSDFCVANKNARVFAKAKLAVYCESQKIPYILFSTLHDVTRALRQLVNESSLCETV